MKAKIAKDTPAEAAGRAKAKASSATAGFALAYRTAYSIHCFTSKLSAKLRMFPPLDVMVS